MESVKPQCKTTHCIKSAVSVLSGEELCLDHFLACCYERMDKLEPLVRRPFLDTAEYLAARAFLEECSNRTLLICLHHDPLSNLDRSRLLNILLLAGDLQMQACRHSRRPAGVVSELSAIFFGKIPAKIENAKGQKDC